MEPRVKQANVQLVSSIKDERDQHWPWLNFCNSDRRRCVVVLGAVILLGGDFGKNLTKFYLAYFEGQNLVSPI